MDQTTLTGKSVIDSFEGEYEFLSNFYNCPVTYKGITYNNSEAAFQAQKATDVYTQVRDFTGVTASVAKKLGRHCSLRPDWNDIRVDEMRAIVLQKFLQNPRLEKRLLDTGTATLIEGNWWNDKFWGVCKGEGCNMLGIILMEVRDYISNLRVAYLTAPAKLEPVDYPYD